MHVLQPPTSKKSCTLCTVSSGEGRAAANAVDRISCEGRSTPKIDVEISVKADIAKLWVDGTRIRIGADGSASASIAAGGHHALSWAVRGAPGTAYSIRITAPTEARLTRGDTFDGDAFDAGIAWFTVKEHEP